MRLRDPFAYVVPRVFDSARHLGQGLLTLPVADIQPSLRPDEDRPAHLFANRPGLSSFHDLEALARSSLLLGLSLDAEAIRRFDLS